MGSYSYDWLLREALGRCAGPKIVRMLLGLNWTVAEMSNGGIGLCFSPVDAPRTLPWPGTLKGRDAVEVGPWIRHWDACEAAVGTAAVNALINADSAALRDAQWLEGGAPGHLRVFEQFRPQIENSRVVVIGRYPGLQQLWSDIDYQCIERRPQAGDLPDTAVDYVLPRADWVFITASSIANKTLPHLLSLTKHASVVLMGPSLPWSYGWADYGVRYLAGVDVRNRTALFEIVAEGGGTRIFDGAVGYRLLAL